MKMHKVFMFAEPDGSAEWRGDCAKWASELRKARPELKERTGKAIGPRWFCFDCEHNFH